MTSLKFEVNNGWNMFKVNSKDANSKDINDVILVSLLLTFSQIVLVFSLLTFDR